ncbi:TPA: ead/Ea22-like family protein [Klebsiella pneumoniae]
MSDITELAQSLKAAANTTADAIDRLKAFPGDELIDLSQHEGEQVDIDIATLNQWYELSSPANVLALVEALERKEEQRANWFQMAQKLGENLDTAEKRIAELESRTVTVKLPERYACELGYNAPDPSGDMLDRDDVLAMLADAGIKVEAE